MSRVCKRCEHSNSEDAKFCLNCGAMLEVDAGEDADPLIGKILLGRYRVTAELGEGGMGKVYRAEQKMGTAVRRVAIKTLHRELSRDKDLVRRFHRECETVIELHHPNTVQFYDFGELEDETLFIVMEFIEGADLAHVLSHGPIEPSRADRLIIQICGSLHEAHQRGIVHRDLKPENVLLTERGGQEDFVKVLDFGIAKKNDAEDQSKTKLTKQGMVLGTPPYMSPEQFSGQSLDFRSDIYSLGVMTYEMLVGDLPFEANTPWEWATKHLTAHPRPIEEHPAGAALPEHKRMAIMRALAKNREDRFQNVLEFMHAFTGFHDAQAAWTMATSAGLSTGSGGGFLGEMRTPVGTPVPMSASGPVHQGTPGAMPARTDPSFGHAPTQASSGQFAGISTHAPTGVSTLVKVAALAATLMIFLSAGGAAALWWWTHRDPIAVASPNNGVYPTTGSVSPGDGDSVASPQDSQADSDETETPTAEDPTVEASEDEAAEDETEAESADEDETEAAESDSAPEPSRATSMMRPVRNAPNEAALASARNSIRDAESALAQNDIERAVRAVSAAQRAVGRQHALVRGVQQQLNRRGSNMVGILLQQGKCRPAQQLYRRLASVGASRGSAQFFSPDWCARP